VRMIRLPPAPVSFWLDGAYPLGQARVLFSLSRS
jgi:hypothetical protein